MLADAPGKGGPLDLGDTPVREPTFGFLVLKNGVHSRKSRMVDCYVCCFFSKIILVKGLWFFNSGCVLIYFSFVMNAAVAVSGIFLGHVLIFFILREKLVSEFCFCCLP